MLLKLSHVVEVPVDYTFECTVLANPMGRAIFCAEAQNMWLHGDRATTLFISRVSSVRFLRRYFPPQNRMERYGYHVYYVLVVLIVRQEVKQE